MLRQIINILKLPDEIDNKNLRRLLKIQMYVSIIQFSVSLLLVVLHILGGY